MDDRTEFNRLSWHSRRGMLEIDVMLMPFTQYHYRTLSTNDQLAYRRLLDCEDQDIWEWLRGFQVPQDESLARIVVKIRQASCDLGVTQADP
ncbi:MAG: succinate dehydrogenase assembly factor 2 [Gammaproteobacteria bacterium]|nr:succinate dehydrogenase assembly factor 2 [Gammaproteobacteria bacterium]